jgi:hypothetical protein
MGKMIVIVGKESSHMLADLEMETDSSTRVNSKEVCNAVGNSFVEFFEGQNIRCSTNVICNGEVFSPENMLKEYVACISSCYSSVSKLGIEDISNAIGPGFQLKLLNNTDNWIFIEVEKKEIDDNVSNIFNDEIIKNKKIGILVYKVIFKGLKKNYFVPGTVFIFPTYVEEGLENRYMYTELQKRTNLCVTFPFCGSDMGFPMVCTVMPPIKGLFATLTCEKCGNGEIKKNLAIVYIERCEGITIGADLDNN